MSLPEIPRDHQKLLDEMNDLIESLRKSYDNGDNNNVAEKINRSRPVLRKAETRCERRPGQRHLALWQKTVKFKMLQLKKAMRGDFTDVDWRDIDTGNPYFVSF